MNRLTKDLHNQYNDYWYREDLDQVFDKEQIVLTKLGQYEDIEEELGCPLEVVFKALKNDFYFKYKDKIISSNDYLFQIRTNIRGNWIFDIISDNLSLLSIKFKDYGKTWALTKEDLENGIK